MTAHTPTPWHLVERWPQPEIRAGDTTIADIRDNGHNQERGQANAAMIVRAVNAHEAHVALADIIRAIRDEQISDSIWGGATGEERREASRIYAARILADAGKIDDALDSLDAALRPTAEGGDRGH